MDRTGTYYRDGLLYCARCRTPIRHIVEFPCGIIRVVGCLCACEDEKFNREREAERRRWKYGRKSVGRSSERIQKGKKVPMGYSHITWACPYFSYDAKRIVKCEAGRITFPDREAEREHTHAFCADVDGWKRCTLAALMSDYYERINDAELERRKKELGL